ncbi:MAG: diaminopimelate epimerase [Bacteroidia bacterium]|nr:diaminopimelate epimerase [Bacteroidia bacterium]
MLLNFHKYQGTGNDFIIIDNRNRQFGDLSVKKLCHTKFGIGADGLMLVQNKEGFDFEMVYYNSDGNISTMCGNGGRCIVEFAKQKGVFEGNETSFLAIDGPHKAIWKPGEVWLQMKDVHTIQKRSDGYILNTGSPHYIVFSDIIRELDIVRQGMGIRYSEEFKTEGINVNFVKKTGKNRISVRTYERGVEKETLSCGTGVTAAAIAFIKDSKETLEGVSQEIEIETPGGKLSVSFDHNNGVFNNVWLKGPAIKVFEGDILTDHFNKEFSPQNKIY